MPIKTKQLESQKIPKLRFAEFEGEWERKRLGEVVEFLRGKGISKEDVIENGKNKCIRYGELYTEYQEVIFEVKSRTNVTQEHSIVSRIDDVLMPSSGETALDISTASCVKENNILLGGDLNIMRPEGTQNGTFIAYYLTNYQSRDIARLAQGHSVVHLYASHLKNLKLRLPLFTEQKKIAEFLGSVDEWIENLRTQKENLEFYKKGMMQKIFSQEVRFKDDGGNDFPDWEEKRLGEVVEFLRGKGISKEDVIENGKNKCIRYGELYTKYQEVIFEVKSRTNVTKEQSTVSKINDVLMPSSGETALDISTASCVKENNILLGGDLNIMRPKEAQNGAFIAYYLTNYQSRNIARWAQGHSVVHLYASHLKNLKLRLPLFTEQQKIANFLISLDNLIESKQQEIAQAEEWKKGLMQEMFV